MKLKIIIILLILMIMSFGVLVGICLVISDPTQKSYNIPTADNAADFAALCSPATIEQD